MHRKIANDTDKSSTQDTDEPVRLSNIVLSIAGVGFRMDVIEINMEIWATVFDEEISKE
jgi:hypothetical protein